MTTTMVSSPSEKPTFLAQRALMMEVPRLSQDQSSSRGPNRLELSAGQEPQVRAAARSAASASRCSVASSVG